MYYQYLPLALCAFLWIDCHHIRNLSGRQIAPQWLAALLSPIRLIANVGAKLFGFMAIVFFLFGLEEIGAIPALVTVLSAIGIAELLNYPLSLMVSKK